MRMILFIAAVFLSAFLLFAVQPMLGKVLLPWLGGSPAVWITAMMVFQGLLLGGYAYAHLVRTRLRPGTHIRVHLFLLAAALLTMPLAPVTGVGIDPVARPSLWLVLSLLATVGLPFLLLSASAPLLQSWFAASGHSRAGNPYFLYAASNFGSFLALISYPLVMERWLGTGSQLIVWSWGYGLLGILVVLLGVGLLRRGAPPVAAATAPEGDTGGVRERAPGLRQRLHWIALAFVPSSLLLGVTYYLTTDIAAFPLLWVIPLALYLLTFVAAFSRLNDGLLKPAFYLQLFFLLAAIFTLALDLANMRVFVLHLAAFTVIAYVCHGRLAAARPHPRYLTEFYLWIALGGVLGGLFNALAAPLLFTDAQEYPLALLAAALLRPARGAGSPGPGPAARRLYALGRALALGLATYAILWLAGEYGSGEELDSLMAGAFVAVCVLTILFARGRPLGVFAVMAATLLGAGHFGSSDGILFKERNFFGTLKVVHDPERNADLLMHGTTIHGMQSRDPVYRFTPTTYYGPLASVFSAVEERAGNAPVALVGLGTGTVMCLGRAGQPFDIYEINPAVVRIAQDTAMFQYLSECPPKDDMRIIMGDARLSMNAADDGRYGLIVLDAYNSDSLPVHLLTREAMMLYLQKLAPRGIVALHVSNRHLDLKPVVQAIAQDLDLLPILGNDDGDDELSFGSEWILLARKDEAGDLASRLPPNWEPLTVAAGPLWTDDYSNVLAAFE